MKAIHLALGALVFSWTAFGQVAQDQAGPNQSASPSLQGVQAPSPLTINHSLSFGMASGLGSSSLQSESFYSTMMQYQFAAPVTLKLNFSLPIYSSFSPYQNLSAQNLQSMNYLKNIPFDVSLAWKPTDHLQFNLMVINPAGANSLGYGMYNPAFMPWGR
jgi:hypothetical protein